MPDGIIGVYRETSLYKKDFNENDTITRVIAQLTQFNDGLESIKDGIVAAGSNYTQS